MPCWCQGLKGNGRLAERQKGNSNNINTAEASTRPLRVWHAGPPKLEDRRLEKAAVTTSAAIFGWQVQNVDCLPSGCCCCCCSFLGSLTIRDYSLVMPSPVKTTVNHLLLDTPIRISRNCVTLQRQYGPEAKVSECFQHLVKGREYHL